MCYAKPGPRCSGHALDELTKAKATGNKASITAAQQEYDRTPDGIRALEAQGRDLEASINRTIREKQVTAHKKTEKAQERLDTYLADKVMERYGSLTSEQLAEEFATLDRGDEVDHPFSIERDGNVISVYGTVESRDGSHQRIDARWSGSGDTGNLDELYDDENAKKLRDRIKTWKTGADAASVAS